MSRFCNTPWAIVLQHVNNACETAIQLRPPEGPQCTTRTVSTRGRHPLRCIRGLARFLLYDVSYVLGVRGKWPQELCRRRRAVCLGTPIGFGRAVVSRMLPTCLAAPRRAGSCPGTVGVKENHDPYRKE